MNCSHWEPLLSAYVDGTVGADDRAAVDAHLRACAACRALTDDLAAISAAAGALEPLVPPARVWHQVSAAAAASQRHGGFSWGWLVWRPVTAVAMTAAIAAGLWRVGTLLDPAAVPRSTPRSSATVAIGLESDAEAGYTMAIARLEEAATADRDALDAETAGALTAGLTVIDLAIRESRAALESEPDNESAQDSLFEALRRKVVLLQETLALNNEMRNGGPDGTAPILSEMNR